MKRASFTSALNIGALSINMAFIAPTDAVNQIRENSVRVLKVLNNGDIDTARKRAEAYTIPYFGFQRITALAVDDPWRTAVDAREQALTKEFQTLLIHTYSGTMLRFRDVRVNIRSSPVVNKGGKEIVVRAEINVSNQKPVNVDSTTYQSGSKCRAYSVAVEDAGLATVYHNQFGGTIKAKGIDGLIAGLGAKNGGK